MLLDFREDMHRLTFYDLALEFASSASQREEEEAVLLLNGPLFLSDGAFWLTLGLCALRRIHFRHHLKLIIFLAQLYSPHNFEIFFVGAKYHFEFLLRQDVQNLVD